MAEVEPTPPPEPILPERTPPEPTPAPSIPSPRVILRFPDPEPPISALAQSLAREVAPVGMRLARNRRALRPLQEPAGGRVYPRGNVEGLIAFTGQDLDQAIGRVGEPRLVALRAWAAVEVRRIQENLATPQGNTIPAETSNRLLDRAEGVVGRILLLAKTDDLVVRLWVGSTPVPQTTFSFWPMGKVQGIALAPAILRTNGERVQVLRGLYSYRATWARGPVTEVIEYPNRAGAPLASARLDLVNGTRFFCCRFNEQYCHHVAKEKECGP